MESQQANFKGRRQPSSAAKSTATQCCPRAHEAREKAAEGGYESHHFILPRENNPNAPSPTPTSTVSCTAHHIIATISQDSEHLFRKDGKRTYSTHYRLLVERDTGGTAKLQRPRGVGTERHRGRGHEAGGHLGIKKAVSTTPQKSIDWMHACERFSGVIGAWTPTTSSKLLMTMLKNPFPMLENPFPMLRAYGNGFRHADRTVLHMPRPSQPAPPLASPLSCLTFSLLRARMLSCVLAYAEAKRGKPAALSGVPVAQKLAPHHAQEPAPPPARWRAPPARCSCFMTSLVPHS